MPGDRPPTGHVEGLGPALGAGGVRACPAMHGPVGQHQMGRDESTTGVEQPAHERGRDAIGRVGHDVERSARKSQVRRVRASDDGPACEAILEVRGTARVELDGDNPCAGVEQGTGDGTEPGPNVEDECPLGEPSVSDEASRGPGGELVESPVPWRSHGGGPSSGSRSCAASERARLGQRQRVSRRPARVVDLRYGRCGVVATIVAC